MYYEIFKNNKHIVVHDFRSMQFDYWNLVFKKDKNAREKEIYAIARKENHRISFLIIFVIIMPGSFLTYFVLIPKKFWPSVLTKIFQRNNI